MRGDVPELYRFILLGQKFSPRARGCSFFALNWVNDDSVFPACAGMFLRGFRSRYHPSKFSPRARGCSSNTTATAPCAPCFPRVRGDVPCCAGPRMILVGFSPRARGCSGAGQIRVRLLVVFPACAGMFLTPATCQRPPHGFPRVRGDVPRIHIHRAFPLVVFPACAGMFPLVLLPKFLMSCFPRVRGDVPTTAHSMDDAKMFSPRARGCSPLVSPLLPPGKVFPACAGMFPRTLCPLPPGRSFPRVRGDVPAVGGENRGHDRFSPRARGCSGPFERLGGLMGVFPACAGMFLRGISPATRKSWFSPRARGCSYANPSGLHACQVFPACAGMFPTGGALDYLHGCFPRVRGDVPHKSISATTLPKFSPRARGCSAHCAIWVLAGGVFPACAGMFLRGFPNRAHPMGFPRVRGDVPGCGLNTFGL